jgi:MFS family permease
MISLARYAQLFAQPEMRGVILASLVGRLPIGISGLALLLLVQANEASVGEAGLVAAVYLAGLAGAAPFVGRLIDRLGPRPVLLAAGLAYPFALVALVSALSHGAALSVVLLLSAAAGATLPQITTCMRTLYRRRLQDDAVLVAALSLDSVLIELVFIIGPMLVAFLVSATSPAVAVLFGAFCGAAGALVITRVPAIRSWPIEPAIRRDLLGLLRDAVFRRLLAALLGYASVFGLVEIAVASYAFELGRPALAGIILGVMSIGSAAGGLAYGSRPWRVPLTRQFSLALIVMGLSVIPMALVASPVSLAVVGALAGITMAPPLIIQSTIVATTMPTSQMAEAFTWVTTAMLCGVGLGFALGGMVAEARDAVAVVLLAAAISIMMGGAAPRLLDGRR